MRSLTRLSGNRKARTARQNSSARNRRPSLERLEDRTVPAILASELIPAISPPAVGPAVGTTAQPIITAPAQSAPSSPVTGGAGGVSAPEQSLPNVPPSGGFNFLPWDPPLVDSSGDPRAAFVRGVYADTLNRLPDEGELAQGVALFNRSGRDAVVRSVENTIEANQFTVHMWYQMLLGREAQNGEEEGWVDALGNGAPKEAVLTGILASDEAFAHAGGSATAFVHFLYDNLLHRTGSAAEVAGWVNILPSIGRQGVINAFEQSLEFRTALVEDFYQRLLAREGSRAEVAGWVFSNMSLPEIVARIKASDEFFNDVTR